jgi:hypothetical protein
MAITDAELQELATAPKRTTTDEGTVEERPISEVIEGQNKLQANDLGDVPLHGLRVSRCKPGGAA